MKLNKHALNSKKGVLLKNTIMLYIMQFSTYFLSFIVVPYETRVLGATVYGKVGVATAIMVYFQLVIDFGFILSATEEVSLHRDDKQRVSRIFTSVTINKILLTIGSIVVLAVLCQAMPSWREDRTFYMLFLVATAVNSMMPDYLYRGLEQMETITIRAVVIKAFFTVMIVLLLKKPEQYCLIPILNIIGYAATLLLSMRICRVSWTFILHGCTPRTSGTTSAVPAHFSIPASQRLFTTASNTVILSIIAAGTSTVGYYSLSDKLVTTAKSGLSPISDSMYPYMTKNKDFKLVWKILKIFMPIIVIGCAVVAVFARPLLTIVFGAGYGDAAPVLRAMLPVVIVILPSYILGFPTLSAMGLSKYANYSVVFGSALHVFNLLVLCFTGHMNMVTLGALVSIAECAILAFRIVVIWRHRDRLNPSKGA